ncbi:Ig-like domain-containing protein [Acidobacteriota bacterium]
MLGKRTAWLAAGLAIVIIFVLTYACKAPPYNPVAPDGSTLYMSANPTSISADGGVSTVTVLIFDDQGAPIEDNKVIQFSTSLGSIEPEVSTAGGKAVAHLAATGEAGIATVTAIANATDQATVDVTVGQIIQTVSVSASPATLPAQGGQSTITAVVFGENNSLASGVSVAFSNNAGSLASGGAPLITNSRGTVTDVLTTTDTATVEASVGDGSVKGTTTVTVEGVTNPANIILVADQVSLPLGGGTVNLTATVLDSDGNLLSGVAVVYKSTKGMLSNTGTIITSNAGEARNTLTTTEDSTVTASTATLSDNVDITIKDLILRLSATTQTITVLGDPIGADPCNTTHPELPLTIFATLEDSNGNRISGREIRFARDTGASAWPFGGFCKNGAFAQYESTAVTDSNGVAAIEYSMNDSTRDACDKQVEACNANPSGCQVCSVAITADVGSVVAENVYHIDALCAPWDAYPCDPNN